MTTQMRPELTITIGLPASGKSTWAKNLVKTGKGKVVQISRDDLRDPMLKQLPFRDRESLAHVIQCTAAEKLLAMGKHVIISDTNLAPTRQEHWRQFAEKHDAIFRKVMFTHIHVEACIERDRRRRDSVGENVIRRMAQEAVDSGMISANAINPNFIGGFDRVHSRDDRLPRAIIVDVDGTVAKMKDRRPYEWNKVGQDELHEDIAELVWNLTDAGTGRKLIFVSGRDAVCREETMNWLKPHFSGYSMGGQDEPTFELHMRPEGDCRPDRVVKEEIFWREIAGKYRVDFVIDDRDSVVEMWREIGLRTLQVAWGKF